MRQVTYNEDFDFCGDALTSILRLCTSLPDRHASVWGTAGETASRLVHCGANASLTARQIEIAVHRRNRGGVFIAKRKLCSETYYREETGLLSRHHHRVSRLTCRRSTANSRGYRQAQRGRRGQTGGLPMTLRLLMLEPKRSGLLKCQLLHGLARHQLNILQREVMLRGSKLAYHRLNFP